MSILQRKQAPEQKTANQSILFLEGGGEGGGVENASHTFSTNDKMFEILHKSKKSEQTLNQLRQHKCLFFQRRKTPEPTTGSKPNQSFRVFLGNPCQQNYPRVNTLLFNLAEFAKTLDGT